MSLLRKIFNYANQKFLIPNVDNRFWRLIAEKPGSVEELYREVAYEKLPIHYRTEDLEAERSGNTALYRFMLHMLTRYVYRISGAKIDPDHQWVILSGREVFRYSNPVVEDPWDGVKPRPSLAGYMLRKTRRVEKGILVRYNWSNYYHFFIDTLAQVYLCDEVGLPASIPLIVPHNFYQLSYVQDFLKYMPLSREVIVQERGQYLAVDELYVAKDLFCNKYYPQFRIPFIDAVLAHGAAMSGYERIFVKRRAGTIRTIANSEEIEAIAERHGFRVVDPGAYTLAEQVRIFAGATEIIGTHGAGLTNILFCRTPSLKLLEILPGAGLEPRHYEDICINLGYKYSSVKGGGLQPGSIFTVDPVAFEASVHAFFAQ